MLGLIAYLVISVALALITMRYEDQVHGESDSALVTLFVLYVIMAPLLLVYFTFKVLAKGIRKIVEK